MKVINAKLPVVSNLNITHDLTTKGCYIGVNLTDESMQYIYGLIDNVCSITGKMYETTINEYKPHVTIIYSEQSNLADIDFNSLCRDLDEVLSVTSNKVELLNSDFLGKEGEYLVVKVKSELLSSLRLTCEKYGIIPTYDVYTPHISLIADVLPEYRSDEILSVVDEQISEYSADIRVCQTIDINPIKDSKKVFLGGVINSKWREYVIPSLSIGYINPVKENWTPADIESEEVDKLSCSHLLYVITPEYRGVYSIAEVVESSNKRPKDTIFVIVKDADTLLLPDDTMSSYLAVKNMVENNGAKAEVVNSYEDLKVYLNSVLY